MKKTIITLALFASSLVQADSASTELVEFTNDNLPLLEVVKDLSASCKTSVKVNGTRG
jgi:hypothetical protein